MPTNDFKTFASAAGANVLSQSQYLAMTSLPTGFQTGIAQSNQVNKVWRQSSIISSMIAQFICDFAGKDALDDGTIATLEANFVAAMQGVWRTKLLANMSLFVSPTGSDSNTGLSASTPFATLQKAWNYIVTQLDLNGFNVTVSVANGTYQTGMTCNGVILGLGAGNSVSFVGNTLTPASCLITTSNKVPIQVTAGANISISGFSLTGSGTIGGITPVPCIVTAGGGAVTITGSMSFGAAASYHMWAQSGGYITVNSSYTITGSASAHYLAAAGSIQTGQPGSVATLIGTPTFSAGFANAQAAGLVAVGANNTMTFSGTANGPRYSATSNGIISSGQSTTFFPGSTVGTTTTGGQYV